MVIDKGIKGWFINIHNNIKMKQNMYSVWHNHLFILLFQRLAKNLNNKIKKMVVSDGVHILFHFNIVL